MKKLLILTLTVIAISTVCKAQIATMSDFDNHPCGTWSQNKPNVTGWITIDTLVVSQFETYCFTAPTNVSDSADSPDVPRPE